MSVNIKNSSQLVGKFLNVDFFSSIKIKFIAVITLVFLINAPISQGINNFISSLGILDENAGAYVNTGINLVIINFIVIFFMNKIIIIPLNYHISMLKKVSQGNLSDNVEVKGNSEFAQLAIETNATMEKLNEVISDIQEKSSNTEQAAAQLEIRLDNIKKSAHEVTSAFEEIANSTHRQAQDTENGSNKAAELGDMIEENKLHLETLNASALKVQSLVDEGLYIVEELSNVTNENVKITDKIQKAIINTNKSAHKIGEASSIIASIAAQTNLLALNASIEAERAGNAGRGFAVVAEEIKTLAQQSSNSTKSIHKDVKELQENSEIVVETMKAVFLTSEKQAEKVIQSKDKFKAIAAATNESTASITNINHSGENMGSMKNEIVCALENLSSSAEKNSALSQEVAASIENQAETIEKITNISKSLSNAAGKLDNKVDKFKV